jgi:uncharacterized membrane protein YeiH
VPNSLASILSLMDYAGLCLFALSGALVAAEKRQTPVTFAFFAIATGVGGGTLRDLLIGQPVFWIGDQITLLLCLAMAALAWAIDLRHWPIRSFLWIDAVGLGAYGAFGAVKAFSIGVGPLASIVMGVLTAAMGGVIRDILAHRPSAIIGPEIYITAAALASAVTVALLSAGLIAPLAGGVGALAGFGLRAGALGWGWQLPHYSKS